MASLPCCIPHHQTASPVIATASGKQTKQGWSSLIHGTVWLLLLFVVVFETESDYVALASFKLTNLLLQLPAGSGVTDIGHNSLFISTISRSYYDKSAGSQAGVAHTFNPSTWEAEAGGFLSSRPAWSTKCVPGQPGIHRETLSQPPSPSPLQKKKKEKKRKGRM
jgi:hypothetical protein